MAVMQQKYVRRIVTVPAGVIVPMMVYGRVCRRHSGAVEVGVTPAINTLVARGGVPARE